MTKLFKVPSGIAEFLIIDINHEIKNYKIKKQEITIGREESGITTDIILKSSQVSREHGVIKLLPGKIDAEYIYFDLDSRNGTIINNKIIGIKSSDGKKSYKLDHGDVIQIGTGSDRVILIFQFKTGANDKWETENIENISEIEIGRAVYPGKGIRFSNEMISARHARIHMEHGKWYIEDTNSTNGVKVNGVKIKKQIVEFGDIIQIANIFIFILSNKIYYYVSQSENNQLVINVISKKAGFKTLLKDINLKIESGNMVLLLGGSGAGKTTLINAVMGFERAKGEFFLGKTDIYKNYKVMKNKIGYVPQEDLIRKEDTVFNTLLDEVKSKVPLNLTRRERSDKVFSTLKCLGLEKYSKSLIGKLSGGQRKRTSIALSYIRDPELFFLDEPDSGLDGIMAKELMINLRKIANEGKIVIVISHSPDRVADLFDKVIVLAKSDKNSKNFKSEKSTYVGAGELAFFGSIREAKEFFEVSSLENILWLINSCNEGGKGEANHYIEKYKRLSEVKDGKKSS